MCPSLIQIESKTAEKNSAQTNRQTDRQTDRHYENNGHLAMSQYCALVIIITITKTGDGISVGDGLADARKADPNWKL